MPISLGLDIGSNSVGSAWVDTDQKLVACGVSIFPAGVDETETKRGSPLNQRRREKRSQRRNIARRARRKKMLRALLVSNGLLPESREEFAKLLNETNPWKLRRKGLFSPLLRYEFGRVLLHLNQRRGAVGIETDPEDPDEGKVKAGIERLNSQKGEKTFGQFMADVQQQRKRSFAGEKGRFYYEPIRNRQYRLSETEHFYADRAVIRDEFARLWESQKSFDGELANLLTDDLRRKFDDASEDDTWRHRGVLFGQRRTYWDTGTLGRCDLEPTDRCCSLADMYAQQFRVIETVNNIRIEERSQAARPLTAQERDRVIDALRKQKTGSVATVRKALGIDKATLRKKNSSEEFYRLNLEKDEDREINTDWFYREIVHGAFTEDRWKSLDQRLRDSINVALLKFDPDSSDHEKQLKSGSMKWWGLSEQQAEQLVAAWKGRPKLEKRVKLSRRAIQNLLPYMDVFDKANDRWPTQIEARQRFADDLTNDTSDVQRRRYALGISTLSKADRHFLKKHPDLLPPAPMLANPVVRKAIHEVRRHIVAYLRKYGRKPDRIVIELTRSAKQSEKVRNSLLALNRTREKMKMSLV